MLGITKLDPREGFTTPLGDQEAVRIIVTEHGKRVFKQSVLGGTLFGVGLMLVLNRFGANKDIGGQAAEALGQQAAETLSKAAETVDPHKR